MNWSNTLQSYSNFLQLEKGLSLNTIQAYNQDIKKLMQYLEMTGNEKSATSIETNDLEGFIKYLNELGVSLRTQARIISGMKSFFNFLIVEEWIHRDPSEFIEGPKLDRHLPDVLSIEEIESIFRAIDLSHPQGHRNKAMLDTLYACGLRVSELVTLRLSNLFMDIGFIKVLGKNNKERLIPIGQQAINSILYYYEYQRKLQNNIAKGHEDYLFLNRNGKKLSRVMIFLLIKDLVSRAGIEKSVSPHTFRHSFATHLVEGGADLRAVQEMLGHESITTTEIYTHLDNSFLRDTILNYHPANRQIRQ
jgi:integrase/recombinase XerD